MLLLQGTAWQRLGQPASAWTCWQEARAESNPATVAQLRQQAQQHITTITAHISDASLRAPFLKLPAVTALADGASTDNKLNGK